MRKFLIPAVLVLSFFMLGFPLGTTGGDRFTTRAFVGPQSQKCLECHVRMNPNLCSSWEKGKHAANGIGCFECHGANATDPDAIADHCGFCISPLVTPLDCGRCHKAEADSFRQSYHSKGGRLLASPTNFLGEVMEGYSASLEGCASCHGSKIKVDPANRAVLADGYPNSGIGRFNPDGSEGSCSACHQRHEFRLDAVRRAEVCGRCHMGPDHPQLEIFKESKHGHALDQGNQGVDMGAPSLVLGRDPITFPTCVTCHLGGTIASGSESSHDPGRRLSWDHSGQIGKRRVSWRANRARMQEVCRNCHSASYVKDHYSRLDKGIALYNHRFALPAAGILEEVRKAGKLDPLPLNEKLERDFHDIWHHQGRRARNGMAMMGADFVQWQGFYEVALTFYFDFLPEAERLLPGVTGPLLEKPEHSWLKNRASSPEETRKAAEESLRFWNEREPDPPEGSH